MFSKSPKSYIKPEDCRRLIKELKAKGERNINNYLKKAFSNCLDCPKGENSGLFELLDNGVTIRYNGNTPGETGVIDGKTYTAVDETMLRAMDSDTDDYTSVATTLVTDMSQLFRTKTLFNQPIGNWDMSNVTDISYMFESAYSFNQPLKNWDTSKVISMSATFNSTDSFNQPLNSWNVSSVENMYKMFERSAYNQPLNSWDVSNVIYMQLMFRNIYAFNQDLSMWCVEHIPSKPDFFDNFVLSGQTTPWVLPRPNWGAPC